MSVTRQSVSTSTSFSTPYGRARLSSGYIIIEDLTGGGYNDSTSDDPAFIEFVQSEDPVFVGDPEAGTSFDGHEPLQKTAVYFKGNEVLVIRYSDTNFTDFANAQEVTKYTLGSSGDKVIVKFDQANDTIIVIDMNGV